LRPNFYFPTVKGPPRIFPPKYLFLLHITCSFCQAETGCCFRFFEAPCLLPLPPLVSWRCPWFFRPARFPPPPPLPLASGKCTRGPSVFQHHFFLSFSFPPTFTWYLSLGPPFSLLRLLARPIHGVSSALFSFLQFSLFFIRRRCLAIRLPAVSLSHSFFFCVLLFFSGVFRF